LPSWSSFFASARAGAAELACDNHLMIRLATLRDPARAARMALALWIIWAILLWNVVFDHVIVVAGREYIAAAVRAANGAGDYARMDDWMRPAITRAFWTATAAATALLLVFLAAQVTIWQSRRIR
jgi:hypothetical protein